MLRIIHAN